MTIKVNHFGPLEGVSFELAPLTIFTGMSSTGKSYANYLVYYFLSKVINGDIVDIVKDKLDMKQSYQEMSFQLDDFLTSLSNGAQSFMARFLGDEAITCDVEFKSRLRNRIFQIVIEKTEENVNKESPLHGRSDRYRVSVDDRVGEYSIGTDTMPFLLANLIAKRILGANYFRSVVFPPGRGAFVGENYSLKREVSSSLGMYEAFFKDYDYGLWELGKDQQDNLASQLLDLTSGGHLLSIDSKQYLQLDEEHRIALSASASSVKDMSPWLFYLKNYPSWEFTFCLEEPEAHQHPSVTVRLADVLAIMLNRGNLFHLTTHSDYLIQRINQLIKLGNIRKIDASAFNEICRVRKLNKDCYIDSGQVKAYYFTKNKKGKTVIESLPVGDNGISMKTFFGVVGDLNEREDYINDALYRLNKKGND